MLSSTAVDDATDTYKQRDTRRSRLLNLLRLDHLNEPEVKNVKELLNEFSDLFHLPDEQLQCTSATKHRITTTDNTPINTKQYRYPPIHKEEIDKQIQDLLKNKVIKPSNSPYNSPLWIVPKKADTQGNKRWRMVIDYRALNEKTVGDAYPLPNITEILDQLGSAKYFSIFDLASGFHQIAMHEDDAPKTAFSTPHGHYQFNRMPFGLKNAPATFQRLMDQVLTGLQGTELFVYLDDIVIYASSLEEHSAKFAKLAQRLRVANLHLQPDKCEFLRKEKREKHKTILRPSRSRNPAEIRLFPLAPELDVSSSDESIFSPRPDPQRQEENSQDQPLDAHDPDDHHDDHPDDSETDTDDSSTTDSTPSPETEIFDQVNEPYVLRNENITEIKDNFLLRKDHKAVFVTQKGDPCDKGARLLQEHDLLPALHSQTLGRASVTTEKEPKIISLVIKERKITQLDIEILREAIQSLRDVRQELQLNSVSLYKGDLENVPSDTIRNLLQQTFEGDPTKILLCNNQIQVPPPGDRRRILEECHSSMIGGHKGVTKTYLRIKEKYQWPNLKEEIQEFIRNCRSCQLKKLVRVKTKQPMVITDTPREAFEKISMDIMGPLPTTSSGNSYILTIQDLLTKYSTAIALRQASALDVADAFINNFICLYGAPKAINQCKTTAYHPQSNGSIERSHHVLWEYLKQYTNTQHEWDEFLNLAMFSYNSSVHEGTFYRPHELVFGKSVRTPSSDPPIEDNLSETYKDYLTTLFNRLKTTQELARENLCGAKARSKRYHDRNLNPQNFRVGSCVYLLKEPSKGKLGDQYSGPYRVLEVLRNNNIRISISENQTKIVHSNKLRLDKAKGPPLRPQASNPHC
ncbi:uncharacterized protein LOC112590215 [Harpegnathos saltator]|uniref:uncharacterized protein LOC112590215 n=1 Tax=Harpegnathos saltator TaxID=610380 RepID=UPI000DBEEB81|nr:uncharacterized protein LOC112590215 [Harpegnathos saltator]